VLHRLLPGSAQPSGAGVQFTGADDAFRARLDAYLEGLRKTLALAPARHTYA